MRPELISATVRSFVGCSAKTNAARLGALVARGVDAPAQAVTWKTNCGTFALGILWLLGVQHKRLSQRYVIGKAPEWLLEIAEDLGVLRGSKSAPAHGQLVHYATPGEADDHFEFVLTDPIANGTALHGGGGRPGNLISAGVGSVTSGGKPIAHVLDLTALPYQQGPTLRRGSVGADVIRWQLIVGGLKPDGAFGPLTAEATETWQRSHGLTSIVDCRTWGAWSEGQ